MEKKDFASHLKKYRNQRGMTAAKLSETADISENYVRRLEAAGAMPTLQMMQKLAEALELTPDCLITDAEMQSPDFLKTISYYRIDTLSERQIHLLKVAVSAIYTSLQDDSTRSVGRRIEEVRISKGLHRMDLSRRLGISSGYLRNIETGRNKASVEIIERICKVLKVDINYLLCDYSKRTEIYVINDLMKQANETLTEEDSEFLKTIYNYIIGGFAATDDGK